MVFFFGSPKKLFGVPAAQLDKPALRFINIYFVTGVEENDCRATLIIIISFFQKTVSHLFLVALIISNVYVPDDSY